jgi:BolA family transcriptional regulator, general stress-responsive regulator
VISSANVLGELRATLERTYDSARHVGHAGASGGHYRVRVVSEAFRGHSPLERHRMVYDAVAPMLSGAVHALNISARTSDEQD